MDEHGLSKWVRRNGGTLSGLELRDIPDRGRGLFATRDLAQGEKIILLPQRLLVTGDVARASPAVAAVLRDMEADGFDESYDILAACEPDETAIVLFVMAERIRMDRMDFDGDALDEDSKTSGEIDWGMWIRSLPSELLTPCTVDPVVVEERLRGTYVLDFVTRLRKELQMLYDDWVIPYAVEKYPQYFPRDSMSLELFLWAHACVESRSFRLVGTRCLDARCADDNSDDSAGCGNRECEDGEKTSALTPFADMMNHSCFPEGVNVVADPWWPNDKDRTKSSRGFQMFAQREVAAGEQLFISYAGHDNSMLLLHYGFAVSGNPNDKIPLTIEEPENLKVIMLLALACGGKLETLQHDLTKADPFPQLLLPTIRLLMLEGEDLEAATKDTDFLKPISVKNERRALESLGDMVQRFRNEQVSPRTGGTGTSLAAFEEFCDACTEGTNFIAASTLARLEQMQTCVLNEE